MCKLSGTLKTHIYISCLSPRCWRLAERIAHLKAIGLLAPLKEPNRNVTQYLFLPLIGIHNESDVHDLMMLYLENRWDRHTFSARCELTKAVSSNSVRFLGVDKLFRKWKCACWWKYLLSTEIMELYFFFIRRHFGK